MQPEIFGSNGSLSKVVSVLENSPVKEALVVKESPGDNVFSMM